MAVTRAHIKASRKYERNNPDRTGYNTLKRNAFNFANAYNKKDTKAHTYVTSDYGRKNYKGDLEELKSLIDHTLENLGK